MTDQGINDRDMSDHGASERGPSGTGGSLPGMLAPRPMRRRGFLIAAASVAASGALASEAVARLSPASADTLPAPERYSESGNGNMNDVNVSDTAADFATIRTRWRDVETGGEQDLDDPTVRSVIESRDATTDTDLGLVDPDPARTAVFTDLPFDPSDDLRSRQVAFACGRLRTMAISWATEGSRHYGSSQLADAILEGVDTVLTHNYIEGAAEDSSWYNHEIAMPRYLGSALTLLYDLVDADLLQRCMATIDWFLPDPHYMYPPDDPRNKLSSSGNRVDLSRNVVVRGAVGENAERVEIGARALTGVFEYATSGDGFYRDGGLIAHNAIPYTGTYGVILLNGAGGLLDLLAGTTWEVTDPAVEILFDSVEHCYAAVVYDNQVFSHVSGRAVSRKDSVEHGQAINIVDGMLTLAGAVGVERARRWREIARGWFERDTFADPLATTDLRRLRLFKNLMDDPDLTGAPEPVGHQLMSSVARPIHRRGDWTFTVSMAREGVHGGYEHNRENEHGWYHGRGASYLYVREDNAQFSDVYWPTVDPLRLPGITAQRRDDMPDGEWRQVYGHFGGGACGDGTYAATGMRMTKGPGEHALSAVKSWFCLDEGIVALGSNITSDGSFPIETVMENRNLHEFGTQRLLVDGVEQPSGLDWSADLGSPNWLHLEGVGGYVPLGDGNDPLIGLREARTATWLDINSYWSTHDDTPYTRRYLTLYFAHGDAPENATYGYLLLPRMSAKSTRRRATDPGVRILSHTDAVHAVHVPRLGFTGANFFSPGSIELAERGRLSVDKNASVVVTRVGDELIVGIANPTHRLDSLTVELTGTGYVPVSTDPTVESTRNGDVVRLAVDTGERDGRTHRATLRRR